MLSSPHRATRSGLGMGANMKRLVLAIALSAAALVTGAHAQSYPTRPVTIIVPYPAGGPTDQVARQVAPKMAAKLGQNFVVENVSRRRHQHRGPARRALGARRPHAVRPQPADLRERLALQVAAVRHREGLPADRHDQLQPAGAGRAEGPRSQDAARAGRVDEDQARAHGPSRRRLHRPSRDRAAGAGARRRGHARSLSRRSPDAAGHARRPHRPVLRDAAAGGRAVRFRRGEGVRHHLEGHLAAVPRRAELRRGLWPEAQHRLLADHACAGRHAEARRRCHRRRIAGGARRSGNPEGLGDQRHVPYPKEQRTPAGAAAYLKSEIERWGQVVRDNKIEAPSN